MCTDKHCGTESKYQNIKDHNNKFPTSNNMLLLIIPYSINHLVFQLHCTCTFHVILSAKRKIAKVWENFASFCILFYLRKLSDQAVMALNGHHVIHRQKLEAIWKL